MITVSSLMMAGRANAAGSDIFTPERLWSMGRLGSVIVSPRGNMIAYTVTEYNIRANNSHTSIYVKDLTNNRTTRLTPASGPSESDPAFIDGGRRIAYLSASDGVTQVWSVNTDGSDRVCISGEKNDVEGFSFSPDGTKVILVEEVPSNTSIARNDSDLPKASGMLVTDLMYKHWDHYVKSIPHPFLATVKEGKISGAEDMLAGQPYECPMMPFGGMEEFSWSPDSKKIAYVLRKKTGRDYATSTDSDIFLYDLETGKTLNLCKGSYYKEDSKPVDYTRSLKDQIDYSKGDYNMGYDDNPKFSPDGKYIAWTSMKRDGYESDRTRLCVYQLSTGHKTYVTESFDSSVDNYCWDPDSRKLYFAGCWHARVNLYFTDLKGKVSQLTDDVCDYSIVGRIPSGRGLLVKRHSISRADELYLVDVTKKEKLTQLTDINKSTYDSTTFGEVKERWVNTVDGKKELCWVIYPPHFDPSKKYPALLYCEGGPQSPVSQFWSYRWNFQIMAANGYVIIAPNRRGLPGFGSEWLEEISGDYTGLCMKDYLSAIDDLAKESYIDKNRLGCVGASFGGYSVYWLAGHHDRRFKCFIAHDGIFNTESQYVETEEMWFANWDMGGAPWVKQNGRIARVYEDSPHKSIDKWDAPILCIHGQKDFRIEYSQAEAAFTAAKLRGIPAELLLFPDENHWVLKPQNGIMWQRTFFRWLDKWLKTNTK